MDKQNADTVRTAWLSLDRPCSLRPSLVELPRPWNSVFSCGGAACPDPHSGSRGKERPHTSPHTQHSLSFVHSSASS